MSAPRVVRVTDPRGLRIRVVGDAVPDHLAAAYEEAIGQHSRRPEVHRAQAPAEVQTVSQQGDDLSSLKRPELLKLAKEKGILARGSNEELLAELRKAGE